MYEKYVETCCTSIHLIQKIKFQIPCKWFYMNTESACQISVKDIGTLTAYSFECSKYAGTLENEVWILKTKHKYDKYHTRFLKENRSVWICAPEQTLTSKPRLSTPIRTTSCHTRQNENKQIIRWDITQNSDVVQLLQFHVHASNRLQEGYILILK